MHESGENYLETILLLKKKNGSVKSIDIAREMNFSKPSVSRAVGLLREQKLIEVSDKGEITLTEAGYHMAEGIYERHTILTRFLVQTAQVDQKTAEEDACRMEHIISAETFEGIKRYLFLS